MFDYMSNSQVRELRKSMESQGFTKFYGSSFTRPENHGGGVVGITLYSYETFVCEYFPSTGRMDIDIDVFDCSASTRRQFGKFLEAYGMWGYYPAIKAAKREELHSQSLMYIPELTGQCFMHKGEDQPMLMFTFC